MLSICAVLILIILGLFFIKKDTQKELTNFVKENAMLLGIALLLFLFYGRNIIEGVDDFEEEELKKQEELKKEEEEERQKKEEEEERQKKEEERQKKEKGVRSNLSVRRAQSKNVRPQTSESELQYASMFDDADINDDGILSNVEFDKAVVNIKGPVKETNDTKKTFEMSGTVYPMPEGEMSNNTAYASADGGS